MASAQNTKLLYTSEFPLGSLVQFAYEDKKYFVLYPRQFRHPVTYSPVLGRYENHVQFLNNKQEFNDYMRHVIIPSSLADKEKWKPENQKLFNTTEPLLLIDGKKVSYQENDLKPKDIWEEITLLMPEMTIASAVASKSQWTFKHLDIAKPY